MKLYHNIAAILIAALFVCAMGFATVHASEHGDHPHEHDGISCDITLIGEEQDHALPPPSSTTAQPDDRQPVPDTQPIRSDVRTGLRSRGPPPRAPPHLLD